MNEFYHDREQTQVKHRVLERYLQAFAPIIGSRYDEIVYVDCMAGPWEAKDEALTDTSFHTALSVFREYRKGGRCKRVRALLIENDPKRYPLLKAYADGIDDLEVLTQQWDFNDHIQDVVSFAKQSRNSFPFIFIDPTGWSEVRIDLIRPILQLNPGEVLINFMSSWVKRFLDDPTKPFQELLGADVDGLRRLQGEELDDELVNTYAAEVKRAGSFVFTCAIPILMPDRDAIHYHLVYGTRHFKGLEVFKITEAVAIPFMHECRAAAQRRRDEASSGQGFLLAPAETYRERRLRSFNERRRQNARADVVQLLTREKTVSYRSLFQEAMQYSTVIEKDLRSWLDEWREGGLIRYANWGKNQRVPRPNTLIERLSVLD
ncbi:MAG: three-Cys-motif partner protein TcmP [Terracidiphilus sp.]